MLTNASASAARVRRGYWLRLARHRAGLPLAAVAVALGYAAKSASTVKMWEDGKRDPSVTQLETLGALYGITPAFFVSPPETDLERMEDWATAPKSQRELDDCSHLPRSPG